MMEMEEYLAIMLEWQEERFQQYCMYCEECMFDVYEVWLQNDGQFNDDDNRNLMEFNKFKEHQRNLGNYDDEYQGGKAIKSYCCGDRKEEGTRLARSDATRSAHEQPMGRSRGVGEREPCRRPLRLDARRGLVSSGLPL